MEQPPRTIVRRRIRVRLNPDGTFTRLPDTPEIRRNNALAQLQALDTRPQIEARRQARAAEILRRAVARPAVTALVRRFVQERRPEINRVTLQVALDPEQLLNRIYRANRRRPFLLRIRVGDQTIAERRFDFRNTPDRRSWETFRTLFYETTDAEFTLPVGARILVYPSTQVQPNPQPQSYRDGHDHCFFVPLIALWSQPAKSQTTQKEHDQILKRVKKIAEEYGDKPVPHDDVPSIAKKTNTTIKIFDPIGNELYTFNPGARKLLCLRHTRNNHVEPTTEQREHRDISYDEAQNLLANDRGEGELVIEGSHLDPIKLYTNTEVLEVINPMKPYLDEIRSQLPDLKFNATKYPLVNEFILHSRIINSATLTFNPDYDQHYDLEKAYTQFHTTSFYQGFLGTIHQWRTFTFPPTQAFLDDHIGIYKARINKPSKLAKMLGMNTGDTLILPSPEWKFHKANGTDFAIISGVWGHRFDFRFPASSIESVKTRIGTSQTKTFKTATTENKPFRIFAGQCSAKINEFHSRTFTLRATREFAGHLASLYKDTDYNDELQLASVNIPLDPVYTKHHLFSFITSYTRIVMMEQMLKLSLENISAVNLDGLYFKGSPTSPFAACFRPKKPRVENPIGNNPWYVPVNIKEDFPALTPYNQNSALLGAGGTGKTHAILTDRGFNQILYVSPTHELGRSKQQEFGVPYTTLHRAIGENCRSYKESYGTPAVIFVDELTQMEASFVTRLIALYPESLIFIAGDIDEQGRHFQCKYSNEIWKPTFKCFTFTTDYRSHTDALKQIKQDLRSFMKTDPSTDDVKEYAKRHFDHTPWLNAVLDFKPDTDVWIAGTHKYINKHPFKIHTTHSYQGKTIEQPRRLFISTDDLFEPTMLYTALSRARHHEQLVFVAGNPVSKEYVQKSLDTEPEEDHDPYLIRLAALYNLTPFHRSAGTDVLNDEATDQCERCKKQYPGFLYTNGTEEYHICKSCIPY